MTPLCASSLAMSLVYSISRHFTTVSNPHLILIRLPGEVVCRHPLLVLEILGRWAEYMLYCLRYMGHIFDFPFFQAFQVLNLEIFSHLDRCLLFLHFFVFCLVIEYSSCSIVYHIIAQFPLRHLSILSLISTVLEYCEKTNVTT